MKHRFRRVQPSPVVDRPRVRIVDATPEPEEDDGITAEEATDVEDDAEVDLSDGVTTGSEASSVLNEYQLQLLEYMSICQQWNSVMHDRYGPRQITRYPEHDPDVQQFLHAIRCLADEIYKIAVELNVPEERIFQHRDKMTSSTRAEIDQDHSLIGKLWYYRTAVAMTKDERDPVEFLQSFYWPSQERSVTIRASAHSELVRNEIALLRIPRVETLSPPPYRGAEPPHQEWSGAADGNESIDLEALSDEELQARFSDQVVANVFDQILREDRWATANLQAVEAEARRRLLQKMQD